MNQIRLLLLAAGGALAVAAMAFAADPNPRDEAIPQNRSPAGITPPGSIQDGAIIDEAQGGAAVSAREQQYLAGLKKCESLEGSQRDQCVEAARKKAGEM